VPVHPDTGNKPGVIVQVSAHQSPLALSLSTVVYIIQIVTDVEVTIGNYFPVVGNIHRGRRTRGIFPTMAHGEIIFNSHR